MDITWPVTEEIYVDLLRSKLTREIDSHLNRVPLDLRKVEGAPAALIDLLIEMRVYAERRGKQLVVTHALPEMRESLNTRRREAVEKRSRNAKANKMRALTPLQH